MKTQAFTLALLTGAALFMSMSAVRAATQSVSANVRFLTDITIQKNADINFGNVEAGTAATYTIDTTGAVTTTGGVVEGGTPVVGNLLIKGSSAQAINISAASPVISNGVSITGETCKYGAASAGSCTITGAAAPGSSGTTLLLGATISADGTQADNTTATPSFTVTVLYQ